MAASPLRTRAERALLSRHGQQRPHSITSWMQSRWRTRRHHIGPRRNLLQEFCRGKLVGKLFFLELLEIQRKLLFGTLSRVIRSFCQRIEWRGFGRLVEPEVLAPTACGGKRLVGTRTSVSSILGSEESIGGAIRRVLLRRHPLQQVSLTLHQTNPRQRAQAKARRQEEGGKELVLHVLAPLRRWRRRRDPVPPLRSCVCRSDRQLPFVKPTPSRRSCSARTKLLT